MLQEEKTSNRCSHDAEMGEM